MAHIMYVCPECKKIFKVQGNNKKVKCTKCAVLLKDTNVSMEEWETLSPKDKENIKQKACMPDNEVINSVPVEVQEVKEPVNTKVCPRCGAPQDNSKFCPSCGYSYYATENVVTPAAAPVMPVVAPITPESQPKKTSSLFDGYEEKVDAAPVNTSKQGVNLMKCPSCGADIDIKSKQCSYCGAFITADMRREREIVTKEGCPKCGSSNITFNREKQGEVKGKKGTAVIRRTVGVCKDCGHTWVTAGSAPKSNKTWLWVLGWICIFPLPLTILMMRKKDMKPALKYGIIAAAWIVYLLIGKFGNTNDTKKAETKEVVEATQEEVKEEPKEEPAEELTEDKKIEEDQQQEEESADSDQKALREAFNKSLGETDPLWYDSVRNDVTGNWRELVVYSNKAIDEELAKEYCAAYFNSDDEVHFIVNLYLKTTTRINKYGDTIAVTCLEYTDGEEHDAKALGGGMELDSFVVNLGSSDPGEEEPAEPTGELLDVTLEVEPKVNADDGSVLFGVATNLPLKTEIMVTVYNDNYSGQDKTVILADGHGYTSEFSDGGKALKGDYTVRVTMVTPKLQKDTVKEIIGEKGENLTGQYVVEGAFEGEKTIEGEFPFSF